MLQCEDVEFAIVFEDEVLACGSSPMSFHDLLHHGSEADFEESRLTEDVREQCEELARHNNLVDVFISPR